MPPVAQLSFLIAPGCTAAAADCLLTEASSIFIGSNKRLEHFGGDIVAVELVELVEPEVKAGEVQVGRGVRVSSQVAEVLHKHKGAVEFVLLQQKVLGDLHEHVSAQGSVGRVRGDLTDERGALGAGEHRAGVGVQSVDESRGAGAVRIASQEIRPLHEGEGK